MKKILLIDDEREFHSDIISLFPKDQFRVISAFDGADGLQKCRNEEFDLIISDYRMPKLDGVKFFQQLRDNQEIKKVELTPVIFVSALVEEMKTKRPKWGKTEFLKKPFDVDDLVERSYKMMGLEYNTLSTVKNDKKHLNPGDVLFDVGDSSDYIYFVVSGVLSGYKRGTDGKDILVSKMGMGELIGDIAVISGTSRVLKIVAEEPSELICIPADKILSIINGQSKWVKLILQNMSRRLDDAVKRIV